MRTLVLCMGAVVSKKGDNALSWPLSDLLWCLLFLREVNLKVSSCSGYWKRKLPDHWMVASMKSCLGVFNKLGVTFLVLLHQCSSLSNACGSAMNVGWVTAAGRKQTCLSLGKQFLCGPERKTKPFLLHVVSLKYGGVRSQRFLAENRNWSMMCFSFFLLLYFILVD